MKYFSTLLNPCCLLQNLLTAPAMELTLSFADTTITAFEVVPSHPRDITVWLCNLTLRTISTGLIRTSALHRNCVGIPNSCLSILKKQGKKKTQVGRKQPLLSWDGCFYHDDDSLGFYGARSTRAKRAASIMKVIFRSTTSTSRHFQCDAECQLNVCLYLALAPKPIERIPNHHYL